MLTSSGVHLRLSTGAVSDPAVAAQAAEHSVTKNVVSCTDATAATHAAFLALMLWLSGSLVASVGLGCGTVDCRCRIDGAYHPRRPRQSLEAALVEESAAAAASLRDQAQRLAGVVSVFNVGARGGRPRQVLLGT